MIIAIISDIHAAIFPFEQVLRRIDALHVDAVYCLGDLVGYGSEPAAVVSLVRRLGIPTVRGNHERMLISGDSPERYNLALAAATLDKGDMLFLQELPESILLPGPDAFFTHEVPGAARGYLYSGGDFTVLDAIPHRHIFLGHTHYPMLSYYDHKVIANPGSVGKPRDGSKAASFLIWDVGRGEYFFHKT